MAQRKNTYRVNSSSVQGEGSWIELSYMTRGETKSENKGDDWADDLLQEHVISWNWVDQAGDEMDVSDLDGLFQHEREFIVGALFNPSAADLKNL